MKGMMLKPRTAKESLDLPDLPTSPVESIPPVPSPVESAPPVPSDAEDDHLSETDLFSSLREDIDSLFDDLNDSRTIHDALNSLVGEESHPESEPETPISEQPQESKGGSCVICLERPSDHAVLPCGHKCLCRICSHGLHRCPICRAIAHCILKIYDCSAP